MTREQFQYDKISIGINRDIRKGNAPTLKNNNNVKNSQKYLHIFSLFLLRFCDVFNLRNIVV